MAYIRRVAQYEAVKINAAVRSDPPEWLKNHINAGRLSFDENKVCIKRVAFFDGKEHESISYYPFNDGDWIVQLEDKLISVYTDDLFSQCFVEA
jgi:protein-L-isoaspartate O-methyltransferase